ncbi:hypothetical protein, partial [Mycoplasmopsis bovis]|uniref:hypothetical protein n=1 Tax=Mycoplasmopsis bovis TaxID=28903 RepID=UPI003D284782
KYQAVAIGNHEFDYGLEHMFNIEKQTAWNAISLATLDIVKPLSESDKGRPWIKSPADSSKSLSKSLFNTSANPCILMTNMVV